MARSSSGPAAPIEATTSITTSVDVDEYTHTCPSSPTGLVTRLATSWPWARLSDEVAERTAPHGKTVRNPPPSDRVASRLMTTFWPTASEPRRPTSTARVSPAPIGAAAPPVPSRVSNTLVPRIVVSLDPVSSPYQPVTSRMTEVVVGVKMHTAPVASRPAITWLARVSPVSKLRLEVSDGLVPQGYTVRNPGPADSVAVRFSATPVARPGTGPIPAMGIRVVVPAANCPVLPSGRGPERLYRMRDGARPWNGSPS